MPKKIVHISYIAAVFRKIMTETTIKMMIMTNISMMTRITKMRTTTTSTEQ